MNTQQLLNKLYKEKSTDGTMDIQNIVNVFEMISAYDFNNKTFMLFNSSSDLFFQCLKELHCLDVLNVMHEISNEESKNSNRILSRTGINAREQFDFGIIEPTLTKTGEKEGIFVETAIKNCKNVFIITKCENAENLLKKYNCSILGEIEVKPERKSNYHKNEGKTIKHTVLLIKN